MTDKFDKPLIMKGAPVAEAITEDLRKRCEALKNRGIVPKLAILRVGENGSDISYEKGALKRAEKVGAAVKSIVLDENASREEILDAVRGINADSSVHACLMLRPLKDKSAEKEASALLVPGKDADCMTGASQAGLYMGDKDSFAPCTAQAVTEMLKYYGTELAGKNAVVIGRSLVIGKPVAMLLLRENATVTICHSKSENLREICRRADIIVAAAGRAEMIDESFLRSGQTVIDVGININGEGRLCGDVKESAKQETGTAYTPVPGGVGAVTTAVLFKHVIEAAEKAADMRQDG